MRIAALAFGFLVVAGSHTALAGDASSAQAPLWDLATTLDRAGPDQIWPTSTTEVTPSFQTRDSTDWPMRLAVYIPAQLKQMPGMSQSKEDQEMRTMVITMGAMSGYMLAAMPVSFSGVVWAAVGGFAAHYWYENYR